jgi:sortase A
VRRAAVAATVLAVRLGVVLVLFAAYSLWGTGLATARAQDELRAAFAAQVAVPATPEPHSAEAAVAPPPPAGEAVAMLRIPVIDLDQAVVQGTSFRSLTKGPGHYSYTPMPGEAGNAAIAGHRTTYGAPFFRLDELQPGHEVLVTTPSGSFRYEVTEKRVVSPRDRSVLKPTAEPSLTLTTCHPAYRATERLIVRAVLRDAPVPSPAPPVAPAAVPARTAPDAPPEDTGHGAAVAASAVATIGLWAAMRRLARRRRLLVWLVLGLPLAFALRSLFDAVHALLPTGA